ncbi:lysylphosphatidylglycerol synthase transmembrane domain-containing protein [Sphingobacterium tabacisoli]|uniref:Lysylphosphatidylglycerol synthase transmembrane domain-containing protein n=1 Tax=Sphingobacterium tabacisoli TaxID=2044855 RepID=A0ABW5L7H6_9SPHI|nr:lysylphosphatidylglycerol synthase transmembrane domain-containing protein [Sphingobacterium tabacisoli]
MGKAAKIVFFTLGIGVLVYMVYAIGLEDIWSNLKQIGWWFLPVMLSWLLIYLMNAFAFRDIIYESTKPETKMPFLKIFQLIVSGYAINYITPFVALGGEPYRIMELKRYVGSAKAGSSVLLYTMMHILSHLAFWVLSVGLILWFVPSSSLVLGTCVIIIVLAVFLTWWFYRVYQKGVAVSLIRSMSRLPLLGTKIRLFGQREEVMLRDIDNHIKELYGEHRTKFYSSLAWEFFARIVGCAEIYFIAIALGLDMTYIEALVVSSGSSLFANLIFFFPMQLGTREGGMAMAMASVGYAASAGIFIGLVTRIRELAWIAIGLIMMLWGKTNEKHIDTDEFKS